MSKNIEFSTQKAGKLFVLSAPSGAGKTTIANEIIKKLSNKYNISKIITYTTRPAREGEINGKDYFFISTEEFHKKEKEGFFLETTNYNDKFYGSPKNFLQEIEKGKSFIIITDIAGVKNLSKIGVNAIFIWVKVLHLDELRRRMLHRGSLSNHQIEERLKLAQEELEEAEKKSRIFDFIVVNENLDQSVSEISLIIKNALEK